MLRKFLDRQLALTEKNKPLRRLRPVISALDAFLYESSHQTTCAPHIRDAVDLKRWMILVVIALLPCTFMAIWNTGVQAWVYTSSDSVQMDAYLQASQSVSGYWRFCFQEGHWMGILGKGLGAFLPVLLISYVVGGLWELLFAIIRQHEVAEGFLVTGLLFPLTLPPTIPYWMVVVGVSFGVIVGKELFGGTGMNILNPALTCRLFLFFSFPAAMTGEIWVGTNPTVAAQSLTMINSELKHPSYDAVTQASPLAIYHVADEIRRIHVDALAWGRGVEVPTTSLIEQRFDRWRTQHEGIGSFDEISPDQLKAFVTGPLLKGGLGLPPDLYPAAYRFSGLRYGMGKESNSNLFWGNRIGSMGETSIFAIALGALFLVWVGLAAWRTMLGMLLGAYCTALMFQLAAHHTGVEEGAWNVARFAFPAYKHLLMGGLAFGIVFMATDPVSSPTMKGAKWIYGFLAGVVTILIRTMNPAYVEGTMLAILFANVFSPLFDYVAVRLYRKRRVVVATV